MAALLVQMIPLGLAAAISPVPIITGVTLTGARRPTASLIAYILGGLLAYSIFAAVGVELIQHTSLLANRGHPSRLALTVELAIGLVMLASALFGFLARGRAGGPPRWMATIQKFGPGRAFLAGIVILSPRVKNLLLLAAACNIAGAADLDPLNDFIAIAFFMVLTLSPVLAPLVVHLTQSREQAQATTGAWAGWLERHNRIILAAVFGIMGLKLAVDGLSGLLS